MAVFAAVDIGSNSVRLKIARVAHHRLKTIHEDRVVTRLGESVFRSGALSPQAMDASVAVLRRFHRTTAKYGASRVRVVATSALREASNASAFVAWVHTATGWKVEIVSGLEEGRLIHLAVLSNARIGASDVLLVDLGGGSCELTVSERGHIREMVSLPLGAVRLTQEFLSHDPPREREIERLCKNIAEEIDRVQKRIAARKISSVVATSGTAASLARAVSVLRHRGRRAAQGPVSQTSVARLAKRLARLGRAGRTKLPGIGPRRSEIIIAGAYVFRELMERCGLPSFRYSPLGLRDGLLAQMLAEYDRGTRPHRQIQAEREDAVQAMCKRYRVSLEAAEKLRKLVVELFHQLRAVHGLPPEYEGWLSTAATLHDVGSFISRSGRRRHTYYLISNSEIFGFTPEQRRIIAAIARYLGKSRPDPSDAPIRILSKADAERIPKAVVLLRLARAVQHGPGAPPMRVVAEVKRGGVMLRLVTRNRPDLEVWMLRKEGPYFRKVFGRTMTVVSGRPKGSARRRT